ncbi:PaaI family thioesterase [uncultured Maricaulis sp.]|uniref:PaaI family thioesterase n=1 Tax=uncultured Maricaulis sp. TaxID=174710 RepID=UPI002639480B|nr:PaaI family thioesterase [uncultured Maricaulis sp.]
MSLTIHMDAAAVAAYLDEVFPQWNQGGIKFGIERIEPGRAIVSAEAQTAHLRPGGTVSGPTLFTLADFAAYAVILGHVGRQALAVTTNLNINFLRKAPPGPVTGQCRLLKLGSRLAVTDCDIKAGGSDDLIAQASATYSLPPKQHHG